MGYIFFMTFFKFLIIILSLLSYKLSSAQEATKSFEIKESEYSENNAIKFAEDFVQPIMRGEAYDISIGEIQIVKDYQKINPIKCVFDSEETGDRNGCHDRVSFKEFYGKDFFDQAPNSRTVYPYSSALTNYNINENTSVIIPFSISLKEDFQKTFLKFLDAESTGYDEMSYRKLPPSRSAEGRYNDYISCSTGYGCRTSPFTLRRLSPQDASTTEALRQSPNFIVKFIDRKKEQVNFYNLKNYRTSLANTKHKFINNICRVMVNGSMDYYGFSEEYIHQPHVQFRDIAVIFMDEKKNEVYRRVINTNDSSEHLLVNVGAKGEKIQADALAFSNDYIFIYDYEKKSITAKENDYLGHRASIGHLMLGVARNSSNFYTDGCRVVGLEAGKPALHFVSNFEFNMIVQMDNSLIREVRSVKIKYIDGNTSKELMYHRR